MRRPRLRLTVRALALVAAVAALLTGGFVLARRSAQYRREALYHSQAAARAAGARRDYHNRLVTKYGRAADRPWLPLDSDPPDLD
jgi:hypothetical protein